MRFLLLTARPELAANRRLAAAAEAAGAQLTVVDATAVVAGTRPAPALLDGGTDLLAIPPDGVLARVGNWRPDSVLAALEVCVAAGVATPNPPTAIRRGRDHWRTVRRLAAAALPVPDTLAGADPEKLAAAAASLGFPVVVKQRRSRMGVGVIRCTAADQLEAVLDSLWRVGDEVVVQRWVECGGVSHRLLVVGGRVVAAARLQAPPGEWRSNAARGGVATAHASAAGEATLARDAAAALGLGVCGVDLLPGPAGPVVAEVNPTPGFRALEAASGSDVAAAIIGQLVALAGARRA